jgi:hypothetical protein
MEIQYDVSWGTPFAQTELSRSGSDYFTEQTQPNQRGSVSLGEKSYILRCMPGDREPAPHR